MTLSAVWAATALAPADDVESARATVRESLTAVRAHLGMEVAFVGRFAGGRRHFAFVDCSGSFRPIRAGDSDDLEDSYCARVVDGRVPELITDATQVPALAAMPATTELPVGAHLSVPLRQPDGTLIGTLCCFSRRPEPGLSERDLNVLRMVADVIAPHVAWLIRHEERVEHVDSLVSSVIAEEGPVVALQPIVDLRSDRVASYEALARFPSEVGWPPDRWFAEAHGIGRGVELEVAALAAALRRLSELPADVGLSVNVSAEALCASDCIVTMLAGVPGGRIVVELTEHQRVLSSTTLSARLAALRAHGVRIAVDDAGSGYAGLEHILHLRPEVLKLDRVLVQGVAQHAGRRAMCEAMVQFTRDTGTSLVAEGVEEAEDLAVLRDIGVQFAQGYLLGRPTVW